MSPCIVTASHLVGERNPGTLLLLCPLTWTHDSEGEATCTDMGFRGLALGVCEQERRNKASNTEPEANSGKLLHQMCKILSGEFGFQRHLVMMVRNAITVIPCTFAPFLNEIAWNRILLSASVTGHKPEAAQQAVRHLCEVIYFMYANYNKTYLFQPTVLED